MLQVIIIAVLMFITAVDRAAAIDVYIVAGQSNAWRLSYIDEYPGRTDHHKVYYFPMACGSRPKTATLKILHSIHSSIYGAGMAKSLLGYAAADIVVMQYCVCGASLQDKINWYPGDDPANGQVNAEGLYASFLAALKDAQLQTEKQGLKWNVRGLFWHQGESDAQGNAAAYGANLRKLFGLFRRDLGDSLPIVAGHIRDLDDQHRTVNAALDAIADDDPLVSSVRSSDLEFESATDVHFSVQGCQELGRRMVTAMIQLHELSIK